MKEYGQYGLHHQLNAELNTEQDLLIVLAGQTLYVQEINQTHQKVNRQETTDNA